MAQLKDLAEHVGGTVVGDGNIEIQRVAPIDSAVEGEITFVANPKYLPKLAQTRASAAIVAPGVEKPGLPLLVCRNPYLAFAKILTLLHTSKPAPLGILPGAQVSASARIGEGVTLYPGCYVGDGAAVGSGTVLHPGVVLYAGAEVGRDCLLHAGVVVREGCRLGDRVIVQPNAVIGSDGFGFAPDGPRYYKIPQVGIVVIEDDVEIGAGSCVDRAALGVTLIRRGVKIDNLVQIAHNVDIGEDSVFAAQVGIAGSAKIGRHATFGGQSAVAGHLRVGANVRVAGRGGVTGDVADNQNLAGLPMQPHREWLKTAMCLPHLPEMRRELHQLRQDLLQLKAKISEDND